MLCIVLFGGCVGRGDYNRAVDNQGRYETERYLRTIEARLEMFNKAMEAAGKTDTPLDDVLVYTRYDQSLSHPQMPQRAILPPADGPEYIRAVGSVIAPFIPWHYTSKMVTAGFGVLKDAAGQRIDTGGGALSITDSYNPQTLTSGGDGSIAGMSRPITDSHNIESQPDLSPEAQTETLAE